MSKSLFCCRFLFLWTFTSHCPSNQDENCTNSSWSQLIPIRYNGSHWFLSRKILKHFKTYEDISKKQRRQVLLPHAQSRITKISATPWVVFEHFLIMSSAARTNTVFRLLHTQKKILSSFVPPSICMNWCKQAEATAI